MPSHQCELHRCRTGKEVLSPQMNSVSLRGVATPDRGYFGYVKVENEKADVDVGESEVYWNPDLLSYRLCVAEVVIACCKACMFIWRAALSSAMLLGMNSVVP